MESKVSRVSIGVDMAKDSFCAAVIYLLNNQNIICKGTRKFPNTPQGFISFIEWVEKKVKVDKRIYWNQRAFITSIWLVSYSIVID